jgi:hypothetical protein
MPLALDIDPVGFVEAEKALAGVPGAFKRAAAESINRGLIAGRKVAAQRIRERYAIKAAALKGEGMKLRKAGWNKLAGALEARGQMLPVSLFSPRAKWKTVAGRRRQFVSVKILKGRGVRRIVKGGFMPGKFGKVFERRQPARLPIYPVMTIGVPFMIGYKRISTLVQNAMAHATQLRMEHLVKFYLDRQRSPAR